MLLVDEICFHMKHLKSEGKANWHLELWPRGKGIIWLVATSEAGAKFELIHEFKEVTVNNGPDNI